MGAHSSGVGTSGARTTHPRRKGGGRHRAQQKRHLEPYAWLGAGAVTLGLGAALVSGAGVASADDDSGSSQSSSGDTSSASGPSESSDSGDTTSKRTTVSSATNTKTGDDDDSDLDSSDESGKAAAEPDEPESDLDETPDDDDTTASTDESSDDSDDDTDDDDTDDDDTDDDDDGADESETETVTFASDERPDDSATPDTEEETVIDTDAPPTANSTFAYRTVDAPSASSFAAAPIAAEAAQITTVPIVGDIFAAVAKDFQDRLNPLFSAALGVYHLQTAVVELRTFHLPSAFLNALNAAFALTTTGLYLIPWGGWLSPIPAALGTGTAYINYVGKSFIPLW